MTILGISCFYHDAAACLIKDGVIVAAASEERFTRKKQDENFPRQAIDFCLQQAGITQQEIDYVGFYDKPFLKFERILETYIDEWPKSYRAFIMAMQSWLTKKLWIDDLIKKELKYKGEIFYVPHHLSHAASAFLPSPFDEAAILTVDGVGEWATTTFGVGRGKDITLLKEIDWPHSLGMLYSAFTYYLGFKVNSAEYKVMGAAPYGKPVYADVIKRELISIRDDGSFTLNMDYFMYQHGLKMINKKFEQLFGEPAKSPEAKMTDFHWNIAASIQEVTNEIMVKMANHVYNETKLKKLCLAGGVALNCTANSKILEQTPFEKIFVQPAAGDAGGALGVACFIDNVILKNGRRTMEPSVYLGPEYTDDEIQTVLDRYQVPYQKMSTQELLPYVAKLIDQQHVIGWFQGRMEWGPRALGNRSIIADARKAENRDRVNLKIKFRESFRPFAPTILVDDTANYFEWDRPSPFMLFVAQVKNDKMGTIPAVTHVDGSARLQTVSEEQNQLFYRLIAEFKKLTGCPLIINTSFNIRGEPIVCSPDDAFRCFMNTHMDYLVMGNFILDKTKMPQLDFSNERTQHIESDIH